MSHNSSGLGLETSNVYHEYPDLQTGVADVDVNKARKI